MSDRLHLLFNSLFRDAFLNTELFSAVAQAQVLPDGRQWEYNTFLPPFGPSGASIPLEAAQSAAAWPPTLVAR